MNPNQSTQANTMPQLSTLLSSKPQYSKGVLGEQKSFQVSLPSVW